MKELTLTQLEQLLDNEAVTATQKEREDFKALILLDHVKDNDTVTCHMFNNGTEEEISAIIAMHMFDSNAFRRIIYRAVTCFEMVVNTKIEKSFDNVENALAELIDNLEAIVGDKKRKGNRKPKRKSNNL
jgi:beta-lactamase regulating signal transducer with metallopeptidase domain